jgi:hypothetical protein
MQTNLTHVFDLFFSDNTVKDPNKDGLWEIISSPYDYTTAVKVV